MPITNSPRQLQWLPPNFPWIYLSDYLGWISASIMLCSIREQSFTGRFLPDPLRKTLYNMEWIINRSVSDKIWMKLHDTGCDLHEIDWMGVPGVKIAPSRQLLLNKRCNRSRRKSPRTKENIQKLQFPFQCSSPARRENLSTH